MSVSNSRPECYVPHSSAFTSPGVSSSKALLLTLPDLPSSVCPLAACGICHLRVRPSGHSRAGGFTPCRCQAALSLLLPWLLRGWVQDLTCQASAQPGRGQRALGGAVTAAIGTSTGAAALVPLWMCSPNLPRRRVLQLCPYPPSPHRWGTLGPSKLVSLQ